MHDDPRTYGGHAYQGATGTYQGEIDPDQVEDWINLECLAVEFPSMAGWCGECKRADST